MFRNTVAVAGRAVRARKFSSSVVPEKGISHGGHPWVLQKEGNWKKRWFADPAAYPIIAITGFACLFAGYKLLIVDAGAPDTHWTKHERGTLDYINNERDPKRAIAWGQTRFHAGPNAGN